ncbi:MAG: iron-containing redox enzyme family protein [Gammaproteobacteria bacterium]
MTSTTDTALSDAPESFYERLLGETEKEREAFLAIPILQAGVAGKIDRSTYLAFLSQAYHHVGQTAPLLMACGERLPARLNWLRKAVAEYISEEIGHEEWILDDIRECGGDAAAVQESTPGFATEQMIAYAWYTVLRGNPVGFFGMVLVLEGTSVSLATRAAGALSESLGLPASCFTYLTSHGSLDVSHMEHFRKLMDRITDDGDQRAIIHCARRMYRLYGDIFRSLTPAASDKGESHEA